MRVWMDEDLKVPLKCWCENPEQGAIEQALNLARLPFAFKHVALMPDTHQGYGMPIGGVLATKGVIIPNAVGVDIGCGMLAVKTSLTEITEEQLKKILGGSKDYKGGIRSNIPVGFNHRSKKCDQAEMPPLKSEEFSQMVFENYDTARKQLGTLGGGNHFIEIQKGSDGHIWFMIHSGSRNLGYKVANYYNDLAKELNKKWYTSVDPKWDLAFLPADSDEGYKYLVEMGYCLDFAYRNRKKMAQDIKNCFTEALGEFLSFTEEVNIHHNYAALENHYGENVWVHRKGATLARNKTIGIIPGSQGTKSYIVSGKGNPESFMSCSHGAGRTMSRKKAQNNLDLATEQALLDEKGILHSIRHKKDLDEAPSAYKDIDVVMKEQEDLVEILVELEPLAVVKG